MFRQSLVTSLVRTSFLRLSLPSLKRRIPRIYTCGFYSTTKLSFVDNRTLELKPPAANVPKLAQKGDVHLRCKSLTQIAYFLKGTEFDKDGQIKVTAGEFSKAELCLKVCPCLLNPFTQ